MKKIAVIVIGLIAALMLAYMSLPRAAPRPPEYLSKLGPELGVTFPPNTRLVGVRRENGMDDWIGAKVEMDARDWPAFLASTPLDELHIGPGDGGHFGPDQAFWDPNSHHDLRSGQVWLEKEFRALNIGVAAIGESRIAVYIVNHGT